ncbi:MAG: DUF4232 domain-containing protein [Mycobacteriales bacterium]
MTRARSWTLGATAAAALLAGCSAAGTTSLAAKGGPSASASQVPTASPSAAPSSGAPTPSPSASGAPWCSAGQLTVSQQTYDYSGGDGSLQNTSELRLTNTSPATCQLQGWPVLAITRNGANVAGTIHRGAPFAETNPDHPSSTATIPQLVTLPPGGDALELIVVGDYYDSPAACPSLIARDTTVTLGLPHAGGTLVVEGLFVLQCPGNVVRESPFVHDHHGFPPNTYSTPPQSVSPGPTSSGPASSAPPTASPS